MKYICAFIGIIIGQALGEFINDTTLVRWTAGLVLGVIGYELPKFIKYARSTPKQFLAFHGPNAPISRTQSAGEIRTFLSQLNKGGLLLDFHPQREDTTVARAQWSELSDAERLTLCQILMQARVLYDNSASELRLLGGDGVVLATYSAIDGSVCFDHEET